MTNHVESPTLQQRLFTAKNSRAYWGAVAMKRTQSLSEALKRAAEVEMVCADLEAQIREQEAGRGEIMKKFRWIYMWVDSQRYNVNILEMDKDGMWRFWGVLSKEGDLYKPAVFNAQRSGYMTIEELLPLKDAMEAVEKQLLDQGTIDEGDLIEDFTQE